MVIHHSYHLISIFICIPAATKGSSDRMRSIHQRHKSVRVPNNLFSDASKRSTRRGSHQLMTLAAGHKRRGSKYSPDFALSSLSGIYGSNPLYAEHVLNILKCFDQKAHRISTPPEFKDDKLKIDSFKPSSLSQKLETIQIVPKNSLERIDVQSKISPFKAKARRYLT